MSYQTLTRALPIVAAAYGRRFGIAIQVGGDRARTDGQMIQIPAIPETPNGRILAYGYLAHEAGHVRFTDFNVPRHRTALGRALENILEDVRIERAMIAQYPGTRQTLDAVIETLVATKRVSLVTLDQSPVEVLANGVLAISRYRYNQQAALAIHAQTAEAVIRQLFGPRLVRRLLALLAELPQMTTTAETFALAQRIEALLMQMAHQPTPDDDAEDEAENQGEDDAGAGDTGEQQADADTDAEADTDTGNDRSQTTTNGGVSQGVGSGTVAAMQAALQSALTATEQDIPEDLYQTVAAALGRQPCYSPPLLPSVERWSGHAPAGQQLLEQVRQHSAKLTTRLHALVEARMLERSRVTGRGRILSARHLHRVAVGDPRVFRLTHQKRRPHTALHLLIDLSMSMSGGRETLALEAGLALALALEPIKGVSCAVSAFPGLTQHTLGITGMLAHGERVATRAAAFVQPARGGTPMTGALWFAAADVLARPEPRKVIVTLTDGDPDHWISAKSLIEQATDAGIQMLGLGIGWDVSELFPFAIQIQDIDDLKTGLFRLTEHLLLA